MSIPVGEGLKDKVTTADPTPAAKSGFITVDLAARNGPPASTPPVTTVPGADKPIGEGTSVTGSAGIGKQRDMNEEIPGKR